MAAAMRPFTVSTAATCFSVHGPTGDQSSQNVLSLLSHPAAVLLSSSVLVFAILETFIHLTV